jgi:hypothetical protein
MTTKASSGKRTPKRPLRDLYLLLAGLLDEIYQDTHMLSGGPFPLDKYPSTAKYLWDAMVADKSVPQEAKARANKDFDFCAKLYQQYLSTKTVDVKLLRTTYLEKRKQIDAKARELLRS